MGAFPLGDPSAAGVEAETVGGGGGEPRFGRRLQGEVMKDRSRRIGVIRQLDKARLCRGRLGLARLLRLAEERGCLRAHRSMSGALSGSKIAAT